MNNAKVISPVPKKLEISELCKQVFSLDMFRADKGNLYFWDENKCHWEFIRQGEEETKIRSLFPDDWQPKLIPSTVAQVAKWLKSEPRLQLKFDEIDHTDEIKFLNGVLNLKTGKIHPAEKKDYFTATLNSNYIEAPVTAPRFEKFCKEAFDEENSEQKRILLEEIIGYTIANTTAARKAFFLIGPSGCGKSVILKFLIEILGTDNVSNLQLQSFAERFGKVQLYGKKANIVGEIPVDKIPSGCLDMFKTIVGGDKILAEHKGQPHFTFLPRATLVFAGNCLPTFSASDGSEALIDRMTILRFRNSIPREKRDVKLLDKLWKERDAIISNSVRRLMDLTKCNFSFFVGPDEERLIAEYRIRGNTIQAFLEEACKFESDGQEYLGDLLEAYKNFCQDQYLILDKDQTFRNRILSMPEIEDIGKRRLNGQPPKRAIKGIKLIENKTKTE